MNTSKVAPDSFNEFISSIQLPPLLTKVASMIDLWYLPFLIAHVLLYLGLVHTSAHSRWRYLIVLGIVTCCSIAVRSQFSLSIPGSAGGQYIWGMMMSSSHWLLLAHATYPKDIKTPAWKWGFDMLRSARWGVSQKILPKFRQIPTRHQLMIRRVWDLAWTLGLLYLVRTYTLLIYDFDFVLSPEGFLHRLSDVSAREWLIRIYLAVRGKLEPYLMLRAGHSFFTIIGLLMGDEPKDWPPLFGSIAGAYRVRSFYIFFWHHLVRKIFTSHAAFLTNKILRVPEGTPTSRYMILALSFSISALMHIFVDPETPLRCSAWPQFRYYLSIAGAIVLEDLAILAYKKWRRRGRSSKKAVTESTTAQGKSTGVANTTTTLQNRHHNADTKGSEQKVMSSADTKANTDVVKPTDLEEDRFMKIVPWFGYLWVLFFEVWSCSKLLYYQKQCMRPKKDHWDWLLEQIQAGGLEESEAPVVSDEL